MLIPLLIIFSIIGAGVGYVVYKRYTSTKAKFARQLKALKVKTTVGAVTVYSKQPLTDVKRNAIVDEFASCVEIAIRLGYTTKLHPSNYTIYELPSERDYNADGVYCPSFKVPIEPGSSYDESQYDQVPGSPGGWIYAAEKVLDLTKCEYAIADSNNYAYIRESVHNGWDHIILFHNDIDRYGQTADHSQGGGHPIVT